MAQSFIDEQVISKFRFEELGPDCLIGYGGG